MTVRLGKALYYCQKCWKLSKELRPKGFSNNNPANNNNQPRAPPAPKVAPKVAPKPTSSVGVTSKPPVPRKPAASDSSDNKQLGANEALAGQANSASDDGVKLLEPPVPPSVTVSASKDQNKNADQTASNLAQKTAEQLKIDSNADSAPEEEPQKNCFICNKPAADGTYYTCGEWQYHENCITCKGCGRGQRDTWEDCLIYPNQEKEGDGDIW